MESRLPSLVYIIMTIHLVLTSWSQHLFRSVPNVVRLQVGKYLVASHPLVVCNLSVAWKFTTNSQSDLAAQSLTYKQDQSERPELSQLDVFWTNC